MTEILAAAALGFAMGMLVQHLRTVRLRKELADFQEIAKTEALLIAADRARG